jgi:cytochrome P450
MLSLFFKPGQMARPLDSAAGSLRIDRSPNPHIAFGRGPHFCMGHYLARMEMQALFAELLQ